MALALKHGQRAGRPARLPPLLPAPLPLPRFAPKDVFAPWLQFLATINPVTYVLRGMRTLTIDGWEWTAVGESLGCILAIGVFTFTLTLLSARWRFRGP